MSKEMIAYLKDVADATIQHILTVQPYEPAIDVDFGGAARVYLANIGFVLANRPDLIEDAELKVKLGITELPPQQQAEVSTDQAKTASDQLNKVALYPDFNVEELRPVLIREILSSTTLLLPDVEEFATYLMELDQFKCTLNGVIDMTFPFRSQHHNNTQSLMEGVVQATLRYTPMTEILQKWWSERGSTAEELSASEKEKIAGEVRKLLIKPLALIIPEVNSLEDFVKFVSEHPLFLEMMAATAEIPVITHFGRRRKTLQEMVQSTIIYKLPLNRLCWDWKQSLNKTPTDPIQSPPEVPSKTEKVYDFLSLSFFKAAVTSPQINVIEGFSKEVVASKLSKTVGIPLPTAFKVVNFLLKAFTEEELKKRFETTPKIQRSFCQRVFWQWMCSNYSFDLYKHLFRSEFNENKVWIHRVLMAEEELRGVIIDNLRINNVTFLEFIYLLVQSDFNGISRHFLGHMHDILSRLDLGALLDTWKRGAEAF